MNKKSALYSCYNQTLTRLLDSLVQRALYIYGVFLFMQGELSLGGVMAFISYSGYVLGPITAIMSIRYMFSSIRPSLKRLNAFFRPGGRRASQAGPAGAKRLRGVLVCLAGRAIFTHAGRAAGGY